MLPVSKCIKGIQVISHLGTYIKQEACHRRNLPDNLCKVPEGAEQKCKNIISVVSKIIHLKRLLNESNVYFVFTKKLL